MVIDTHAHYDDKRFEEDLDRIMCDMKAQGMIAVNASIDRKSWEDTIRLIETYDPLYGMLGIYPEYVADYGDQDLDRIRELAAHERIVAIGEIGLDYHYENHPDKELQMEWFRKQISLA